MISIHRSPLVDPNLYIYKHEGITIIAIVWVDDIAVGFSSNTAFDGMTTYLQPIINLKVMDLNMFVGIDISRNRDRKSISLGQQDYIETLARKHIDVENIKEWKHQLPSGTPE